MKIYITTCNEYKAITAANVALLNKYWPGQEIVILCYELPPDFTPPENVQVISLGSEPANRIWTDPIIEYFTYRCEDPYFVLLLDDYILVKPVDMVRLKTMETEVLNKRADKAFLTGHLSIKTPEKFPAAINKYTVRYTFDHLLPEEHKTYVRMSPRFSNDLPTSNAGWGKLGVSPAIWTREYFLRHIRPNQTLWNFVHDSEAMVDDGARVIEFADGSNIFKYMHLLTKGKGGTGKTELTPEILGPEEFEVDEEDLETICELGLVEIQSVRFRYGY